MLVYDNSNQSRKLIANLKNIFQRTIEPVVIKVFNIFVFGGIGSIWGTVIGGLLLGIVENLGMLFMSPSLASASSLIFLIILIIVKPTGLLGKS